MSLNSPIYFYCVSTTSGQLESIWFRVRLWPFGGRGLMLKSKLVRPLFSERNGYRRHLKLPGGWRLEYLGADR